MGRNRDWKESAKQSIQEALCEEEEMLNEKKRHIEELRRELRKEVRVDNPDAKECEELMRQIKDVYKELAEESYDAAYEMQKRVNSSTIRNLEGKEPVGYSKSDGGFTTDAIYGAKAMNNSMMRNLTWLIDFSEWDHEKGEKTRDGIENVEAEGVEKYEKHIGGRKVTILLGEQEPPV